MVMEYVTKSRAEIKDVAELLARGEDKEEVFIDTPTVFVLLLTMCSPGYCPGIHRKHSIG